MGHLKQIDSHWYEEALEFCRSKPSKTVYVASWINEQLYGSPLVPQGWLMGEFDQSQKIVGLAFISETGILFPVLHAHQSFSQIEAIARANPGMIRVVLGSKDLVDLLWPRLEKQGLSARLNRNQIVYFTDQKHFTPCEGEITLKIAESSDVRDIVEASADMAREESGDDAQARNPRRFREQIEIRLKINRDFIHRIEGELSFKASVSALAECGGQLEGIYTVPRFRRRGLGRRGTSTLTRWVLQRSDNAFLVVGQENKTAQKIYESLGFSRDHQCRMIFVAP